MIEVSISRVRKNGIGCSILGLRAKVWIPTEIINLSICNVVSGRSKYT